MKALITGGAGFIGSHLSEELLRRDCEVVVVDNLSTGSLDNLESINSDRRFRFIHDDVCNAKVMRKLIEQCDVIFHFAAAVGVQLVINRPIDTIKTNVHGTEVVLRFANEFCKKVLLASTSEVYGKRKTVPLREDDNTVLGSPRHSRWAYACTKVIDEFLGIAYYEQYRLPVVMVRLFNTAGPRQISRYGMVIPSFVERALKHEPILIYGTGKQTRSFAYVGDVVNGVIALMDCPAAAGQVYNIGSVEEISIEALADKIIDMTGSNSVKVFIPYEEAYGKCCDDIKRRVILAMRTAVLPPPQHSVTVLICWIRYTFKQLDRLGRSLNMRSR